jgi:hypothetical protein
MPTPTQRATLVSTGLHLYALRRIGKNSYSPEEYLMAAEAAREAGDGEAYADRVLGPDLDMLLSATEQDDDGIEAAHRDLRERGVDPEDATYEQLAAALVRVSP